MSPDREPWVVFTSIGPNAWVYEESLRFLGLDIGRITTVVRLSSGGLFVQSPAELTDDLRAALDELGEVRFVVPTSKLHGHLYMEQYRAAYPEVELLAAPGLPARRPELTFDGLLGSVPDPRWSGDIDQTAIQGNRLITELAFFHRPSKTLILGDAGYHITEEAPRLVRLLARVVGVYGRVGAPVDFRATVTNETTLRRSIQEVLTWDFERVVPGHGSIVERDARAAVVSGYEWVL